MVWSSVQAWVFEILRNFRKGKNYVLWPHVVAVLATEQWSILLVFCPGRTNTLCCKRGNIIPNTAELVHRLSVLYSYPYVVYLLYLVHDLLISFPVLGIHTSSLGLKNECRHQESRYGFATFWGLESRLNNPHHLIVGHAILVWRPKHNNILAETNLIFLPLKGSVIFGPGYCCSCGILLAKAVLRLQRMN